jgi:hypothetical protein
MKRPGFWVPVLFVGLLVILFYLNSDGLFDSSDGIRHFEISRFSWNHPELFLHHWGKPFFTLISSPFSQAGINGILLFNFICGMGSGIIIQNFLRRSAMTPPWLGLMLLFGAPVFFGTLFSGLTEPFFAFVLSLGIYLLYYQKFVPALLLLGALPFIRTEGFLLLPVWIFYGLTKNKTKYVWLPLVGTVVYTISGGLVYGDFLWIIHQNPYTGNNPYYGAGSLFYFIGKNEFIWGIPGFVLLITGLVSPIIGIWKKKRINSDLLFLIYVPFLIFFLAHSLLWFLGKGGSIGLIRVFAGVAPLTALIGVFGFQTFANLFRLSGKAWMIAAGIISLGTLFYPVKQFWPGFQKDHETEVIEAAVETTRAGIGEETIIYYQHPGITFALNRDPFNENLCRELWFLPKDNPGSHLKPGTLIFWDSHYGKYEAGMDADALEADSLLSRIARFKSKSSEHDLGLGTAVYEVRVYKRVAQ